MRPVRAIAAVLAATTLVVLDAAIVNLALPTIGHALRVSPAMSILVVTAYQLALVMALLPCAALGESLGFRRVFTAGVALFTAASALCAAAPSLPWLVTARFLQGLGGAAVMALGVALLRQVVPPHRLGAAIGWNALTVALATATGPSLGAVILSAASGPWLFALNLPIGAAALLASRALPRSPGSSRALDPLSIALNGGVFAALVVGVDLLPTQPHLSLVLLLGAGAGLAMLVRREAPKAFPLVPLDLLRVPSVSISAAASVCLFTGQTAALVALPFYLQHGLGLSALQMALYITPWPLTVAIAAPVAGYLSDRVSTAWLCALGGGILALGLSAMAIQARGAPQILVPCVMLCGLGFGLFQAPNNRNMFLGAPPERSGAAGGLQGTARLTGQTAGAVLMTALFTATSVDLAPRLGLGIGAALALTAGAVSTLRAGRRSLSAARPAPR
ncbi:multidrug ABC transporter [Caulobacter sp. Root655]|nr:multidrug ABC transporter [Caulobacter sp. Root655]